MNRIQCTRQSPGALAGHGAAAQQAAGDRRAVMRRAGDLAVACRRPFGVAMVLAALQLFAGTVNATAAAAPAGNAPVVSARNAAMSGMAWAAPRAGFSGETARTDGVAFGERVVQEHAQVGIAPELVTTSTTPGFMHYPRAFIDWKLSARPL